MHGACPCGKISGNVVELSRVQNCVTDYSYAPYPVNPSSMDTCNIAHENASKWMRPLRPQSWWTICCREPFHGAATRSRDSLPMYHLSPTRVPSVRKQHCFISFAILFHMFPLVIYCLLHQWNHRVTGYEFCNRVEPKTRTETDYYEYSWGPYNVVIFPRKFFQELVWNEFHLDL